jgi:hypothetical protein
MPPTERISLSREENSLIRAGLDRLVNGVEELRLSGRRSLDLVYPGLGMKYQPRHLSTDHYTIIKSLRSKLIDNAFRASKIRLDHMLLLIAGLALRIAPGHLSSKGVKAKLERKLERYRKRAKRSFIKRVGDESYDQEMLAWKSTRNWLRFNVLSHRVPSRPLVRQLHREQRDRICLMAKSVIAERCVQPLDPGTLDHMVTLAIDELRRDRHPGLSVRKLISNPDLAHEFLFTFIKKRVPSMQIRFEFLTKCEQWSIRSKQFEQALCIRTEDSPEHVELEAISERKVQQAIAKFFQSQVHPKDWETIVEQVEFMSLRFKPKCIPGMARSLGELLEATKPQEESDDLFEEHNLRVQWLLEFLAGINASGQRASNLVRGGWILAKSAA